MTILRLTLTVDFLQSDFAPKMSIFSGSTDQVLRQPMRIYPPLPLPFRHDTRFHWPVRIARVPQEHLERSSRILADLLRWICIPFMVVGTLFFAYMSWSWLELGASWFVTVPLTGTFAYAWLVFYLVELVPRHRVQIKMLDQAEYLELRVPDNLAVIHETYAKAYTAWIAAGCPRADLDLNEESWGQEISTGWDESNK